MNDIVLCLINVALLVCGQLMLKLGTHGKDVSSIADIIRLLFTPYMLVAIALYGAATLLWVYILTKVPISYAYPIQALAFPMVVIMSVLLFQESAPVNRWIGVAIIIVGVFIASR